MGGGKKKKEGARSQSQTDRETRNNGNASSSETRSENGDDTEDETAPATLSSMRRVVSEVVAAGMRDLKSEMKKELSQVRTSFKEDMKKQLNELTTEINQQVSAATGKIEEVAERLGEIEKNMTGKEKWDIGVKDTLIQLLDNQKFLQEKITDLEGRSRRNNIRIYGIPENAEGSSMLRYVEHMILTELGDNVGLRGEGSLGIERAHRSLGPQPPAGAPPRSTVLRFLQFNIKEKILLAAWKKPICVQEKRVYFDHDYAENVQQRRKEYTPIKKVLKEKRIRFQTPLTRMRVHFDSGTVTYSNAEDAAEDLKRRGFTVGPLSLRRSKDITVETINKLLPWSTAGTRREGNAHNCQESAHEKCFRGQPACHNNG